MAESAEQQPEYSPDLLYKFLLEDGRSPFARAAWKLPGSGLEAPGECMPPVTNLAECRRGYHLCRERDLLRWISSPALYVAEGRRAKLEAEDKVVHESARLLYRLETWNLKTRSLFASDCAERVLHVFEEQYPDDPRPRRAIEAVRAYWSGAASGEAVEAAAYAAVNDAPPGDDAPWAASSAAFSAIDTSYSVAAVYAPTDTADAAAYAAKDAGEDPDKARQREREWQLERLLEYLWPERKGEG